MTAGRRIFFLLLLLAYWAQGSLRAQPAAYNFSLALEIDSMAAADLKWRQQLRHYERSGLGDTVIGNGLQRGLQATVSANNTALRGIFDRFGYPGLREIGASGSEHLWWLIQHADGDPALQRRALHLLREQYQRQNLSGRYYAYLQDRVLVNAGEPQWYGTQLVLNRDSSSFEPRPVADPAKINERRAALGLGTIEAYVELMNKKHREFLRPRE
ncbi:MAG: hypothetical protein EOO16_13970 [Chitinophagaceae bacterium]|nr:MAG: hypothetical protein EOO16_13970 [Chitinophagaceae bacterium]